jgi:hypothetical protein
MNALFITLVFSVVANAQRGRQVVGYWENWVDVNWWGNNIPGNCLMGCAQPVPFFQKTAPYSQINYGFTFLTENPNPKQVTCANSTANCPIWDGRGIYAAQASKQGATVVDASTDIHSIDNSPGLIAISEICRLARQGPTGPKRCLITLGGWSDWARIGNVENGKKLGELAAKMVLLSFADGIDLDFEHLTEFNWIDSGSNEFDAFNAFINTVRQQLSTFTSSVWNSNAESRYNDLNTAYNKMPQWQKNESPYYPSNMKYMKELQQNGPPYFQISWTTRFNAFLNKSDPFNYLAPGSPVPPPFATDNEGLKIWPSSGNAIDSLNIMAYDGGSPAGPLKFNFDQILRNFAAYGPPAWKQNMGFEPGEQNAGGVWEGITTDEQVAQFIRQKAYGGAMVWAINPDASELPKSAHWAPILAKALNGIIEPTWYNGKVPTYSKCNPQTGW